MTIPALPPGFVLQNDPAPPPGFDLIGQSDTPWQPKKRTVADLKANAAQYQQDHPVTEGDSFLHNAVVSAGADLAQLPANILENIVSGGPMGKLAGVQNVPYLGAPARYLAQQRHEHDAQAQAAYNAPGGTTGRVAAFMLPAVATGAATAYAAPAALPLVNPSTLGGMGLQGLALGASAPADSRAELAGNTAMGGLGGLAGGLVFKGLKGATYTLPKWVMERFSDAGAVRRVAQEMADQGVDPAPILAQAPVEGLNLTAAQATGDPALARMTRARNAQGGEFSNQLHYQISGNQQVINDRVAGMAGTPEQLQAAIDARAKAANPLFEQTRRTNGIDTSGVLSAARRGVNRLEGNSTAQANMQDVVQGLTRNIPENVRLSSARQPIADYLATGARRSAADNETLTAAAKIINQRGQTVDGALQALKLIRPSSKAGQDLIAAARQTLRTASVPEDRGMVLSNFRETLGDMINGKPVGRNATQRGTDRNVIPIKSRLEMAMGQQVPEFAQAMQGYRSMSGPVNRLQVLQHLGGKDGRLYDPRGNVTLQKLDSTLGSGPGIVKQQTGMKRMGLDQVLTPADMQLLEGSRQYFRMAANAANAGAGTNSHTAQNLLNVVGSQSSGLVKKLLPRTVGVISTLGDVLDAAGQKRFNAALNQALLDPSKLQAALAMLPRRHQQQAVATLLDIAPSGGQLGQSLTLSATGTGQ